MDKTWWTYSSLYFETNEKLLASKTKQFHVPTRTIFVHSRFYLIEIEKNNKYDNKKKVISFENNTGLNL